MALCGLLWLFVVCYVRVLWLGMVWFGMVGMEGWCKNAVAMLCHGMER